jgi:hypothetical protein
LYLCLSPVWGAAGGDLLNPHYSWDHNGNQAEKIGPQDIKKKRDSPARRSLYEILRLGAGSSGTPLRVMVATSEPAVVISAEGRDEPAVRKLPEVKLRTPLLGVSSTDISLKTGSNSDIHTAGEGRQTSFGKESTVRLCQKTEKGTTTGKRSGN